MSGGYSQHGAGTDQIAKWKAALAASKRQQRTRRGKRKTGIDAVNGPGMFVRQPPRQDGKP